MNESDDFRRCLGRFATGVTVVTCTDDAGAPCGVTANSFSSVSLEPRLVLWNIAKVTNSLEVFLTAPHFVINVLGRSQESVSRHFAEADHTRFESVRTTRSARGLPLIPGAIATFECRTDRIHDCGDHHIIIGEVESFAATDDEPLLFFGGRYAALGAAG